ncbi:MAG: hypothetical protein CVT92_09845 [Bacteroidetes bacterium HGW-Bacteroidetes-1]|jgi:hypothetical protein|nr:MAG: hypothetical protein CVT92_09845 [Bacteroidetes bacterium HGW-Bacteroidetes-1]
MAHEDSDESKRFSSNKDQNHLKLFFKWFVAHRKIQFSFLLMVGILPLFLLIYGVLIPVSIFKPIPYNKTEVNDTISSVLTKPNKEQVKKLYEIIAKEKKLNLQRNRLKLAQQDSIYLLLNLADSNIILEVKGLPIRTARILDFETSKRLVVADHEDLLQWISDPFSLKQELSTILKIPILVVDAPKDTAEAARLPRKPLEPEKTVVHYTLWFDRGLVLEVNQAEDVNPEDEGLLHSYHKKYDSIFHRTILAKMIDPLPDDLPIKVKVTLSEADARAIYRAIPHSQNAKLIFTP